MATIDSRLAKQRNKAANQARLCSDLKFCGKCQTAKLKTEFSKASDRPDGRRGHCKACRRIASKVYRERNPEKMAALVAAWAKNNPERVAAKTARFAAKQPATYFSDNARRYRQRHPDRRKASQSASNKKRRSSPKGRLSTRISNSLRASLNRGRKNCPTFTLLGYSLEELKVHIERQFCDGMNWRLFLDGHIHIDHIRPLDQFEFKTTADAEFKQAWALANLRPLWAKENLRKSAKRLFLI